MEKMKNSTLQNVSNSNLLQIIIFVLGFAIEALFIDVSVTLVIATLLHISLALYLRSQLLIVKESIETVTISIDKVSHGNFDVIALEIGKGEIFDLGHEFNSMMQQLKHYMGETTKAVKIAEDIDKSYYADTQGLNKIFKEAADAINNSVKIIENGYKAQRRGVFTDKLHSFGGGIARSLSII